MKVKNIHLENLKSINIQNTNTELFNGFLHGFIYFLQTEEHFKTNDLFQRLLTYKKSTRMLLLNGRKCNVQHSGIVHRNRRANRVTATSVKSTGCYRKKTVIFNAF